MKVDSSIVEPQLSDSNVGDGKNSSDMISLDEIVQELGGLLQQKGLDTSQAFQIASRFVVGLKKKNSVSDTVPNKSGKDRDIKPKAKAEGLIVKPSYKRINKTKVEPLATTTPAADGTRTFNGQYRVHWKVGKWVELKHNDIDWLPGTITRVSYTDQGDFYDVKLRNGDIVLNVNSDYLRTCNIPVWLALILLPFGALIFSVAFISMLYMLVIIIPSPAGRSYHL